METFEEERRDYIDGSGGGGEFKGYEKNNLMNRLSYFGYPVEMVCNKRVQFTFSIFH